MKTRNKFLSVFLTFSLIFTLLLPLFSPITAAAEGEVVLIESRDDFIEFAKNCSYDLYSRGKSFMLTSDIDLEGIEDEVTPEIIEELLAVDKELWRQEAAGVREFYAKFDGKVPGELMNELTRLEEVMK